MTLKELFISPFSYGFMQRGLVSALLLSISGGLLGSILVLRRLSLMGDALSHSVLPGIAIAWLIFGPSPVALFIGALIAGLLTALGSAALSRLTKVKEDAAFGSLFIVFFGAGVALLSRLPVRINLENFLFGSILSVSPSDIKLSLSVSALTVAVFIIARRGILLETFDPLFHRATGGKGGFIHALLLILTVLNLVAGMQTMGVVLSLGLFLLPAVTAYLWCETFLKLLLTACTLALISSFSGILISYYTGIASGACIVLCLGAIFITSVIFSPTHGVLSKLIETAKQQRSVNHSLD
jgi:zinc/manganese transport system permease protein